MEISLFPYGKSGLKLERFQAPDFPHVSLPVWEEWIEMIVWLQSAHSLFVSSRMGRVD